MRVGFNTCKVLGTGFTGMLAFVIVACNSPHQYIDVTCSKMSGETILDREVAIQCQTFRQAEAATAVYQEATLLVKAYRSCLEKYEQTPARSKEYCAPYPKALQEIGLKINEEPESLPSQNAGRTTSVKPQ